MSRFTHEELYEAIRELIFPNDPISTGHVLASWAQSHIKAAEDRERAAIVAWLKRLDERTPLYKALNERLGGRIEAGEHLKNKTEKSG